MYQTRVHKVQFVVLHDMNYIVLLLLLQLILCQPEQFLLENEIITENNKINELFDVLINETNLEKEIKNLVIYKKALFNSEFETENNLIKILNPIINSESIWKSHALHLMAEYFYFKNEKQKSKEFFEKIVTQEKSNLSIKKEAQKRLNRDFSE